MIDNEQENFDEDSAEEFDAGFDQPGNDDEDGRPTAGTQPDDDIPASPDNGEEAAVPTPPPSVEPPAVPEPAPQPEPQPQPVQRPAITEVPEDIEDELEELRKLNPRAAQLAMEDSPEGEGIRRRLAEYGALNAQDRAENVLDRRAREDSARQYQRTRQQQAIDAHNRNFRSVIARDHPDFSALMSDPNRKTEAARVVSDIKAWIGRKPYNEAVSMMEIAERGRDPRQVSALITRYKREQGKGVIRRKPGPEGAFAVPGRGVASAPTGDMGMDDFDAGFDL